jgi:CRP/FNR family cyclic AMP-dependent transcriptional regulator
MLKELKKRKHFCSFKEDDWSNLEIAGSLCDFSAGDVVFADGARGRDMYIILQGEAQVHKNVSGRDVLIASLGIGDIFGEMAILEDMPRSAEVRAKTDCALLRISADNLDKLRQENVATGLKLMDVMIVELSHRIREANKSMEIVKFWIT